MSRASERFTLLLADIYATPGQQVIFVADAVTDKAGQSLLYGADPQAQLHLLAPVTPEYMFTPQHREQIELTEWTHPKTGQRYLDLICGSEALSQVFALMADSVVERVADRDELGHTALLGALNDWQELLRPARKLSEDAARGLFGELIVLRLLAAHNPIFAVESWTGPDNQKHDFSTPRGDLEVKSSAKEDLDVTISSLDQLDLINNVPLTLIRVRVVSSSTGKNIEDLVVELEEMGCLRAEMIHRLASAGFILGVDDDDQRFSVDGPLLAWELGPDFPGLRRSDLAEEHCEAITRLRYDLSLQGAPGRLDDTRLSEVLKLVMTL